MLVNVHASIYILVNGRKNTVIERELEGEGEEEEEECY